MVSSVTYMDGRPCSTANLTAFSVVRSRWSTVQSSTRRRIGLVPRNVAASMAMPARCAIGLDLHAVRGDFARERLGIRHGPGTRARQTNIYGIYAERFHQMQDFDLFFDARIENGWILQPVAKRFVIQQDARAGRDRRRRGEVPIVNPFVLRQGDLVYCG